MSTEPPAFQESSRCDVCKCSFNTFRRRHHCRCCGRTLCAEHSSNQMALPQFGVYSPVRVCSSCFNGSSRSGNDDAQASENGADLVTESVSTLDISGQSADSIPGPTAVSGVLECKCGMPLCICEAPSNDTVVTAQSKTTFSSTVKPYPELKKAEVTPKSRGSTSNKHGVASNLGQGSSNSLGKPLSEYEVNGEGLREAIKCGDVDAVRKLLSKGVDANYCDKKGLSLLHLAAVFNQTDIAFILMEFGASLECKNAQGETPLDCAPATLQFKMKRKMEEGRK